MLVREGYDRPLTHWARGPVQRAGQAAGARGKGGPGRELKQHLFAEDRGQLNRELVISEPSSGEHEPFLVVGRLRDLSADVSESEFGLEEVGV